MGEIICQTCDSTIEHFEDEKVTKLYANKCPNCANHKNEQQK
ncbi:GapA-binding peptide SR1P [Fictibacillus sp. KU28468]|nr:GapA-binding peptide SR1P [Fictibacillus sp. KU28468]UZJ77315.1 GapA-binding peptide SR1P [Fictibacillus sp. KU28468]